MFSIQKREMRVMARVVAGLALAIAGVVACADVSKILDQEAPSRVDASTLDNPAYAQLLVNGAIGDFECAFAQYIVATGLEGDELIDAQLSQAGWDYDRRTIFTGSPPYGTSTCTATQVPALYTPLSVARFQADNVLKKLQGWTDTQVAKRPLLIGQAALYAGYSLELLGEAMCTAAIDLGPEMSRTQLFTAAQDRFTTAITSLGSVTGTKADTLKADSLRTAARIGRARALLNLAYVGTFDASKLTAARADAAAVTDANFVFNATYSSAITRRENLVWSQMYRGLYSSVDPSYRGVTWAGVADPRVNVVNANSNGQDRATPVWRQTKYPLINSPIPIARYAEAQLIIAEADNATGGAAGTTNAVNIINALHTKAGIPPYAGGTQAQVQAQIIEERRREFFLESQRLGDVIRYNLTVTPVKTTPFKNGGTYGPDTGIQLCFPLPDIERNNNPSITKP